jgi:hypothetical protein
VPFTASPYSPHQWLNGRTDAPYGPLNDTRLGEMETALANLGGGANAYAWLLKAWTTAESYELTGTRTLNSNGYVTSSSVTWPDGSGGTFTATATDATYGAINSYTITHTLTGATVTQSAVTRNASGDVTVKPALTVA